MKHKYIYLCTSGKRVFQELRVLDVYTREIKCVFTQTSTDDVHGSSIYDSPTLEIINSPFKTISEGSEGSWCLILSRSTAK